MPSFLAVTQHNIVFQAALMGRARDAIVEGTFPNFLRTFFRRYFMPRDTPSTSRKKQSKPRDAEQKNDAASKVEEAPQLDAAKTLKAKVPVYPKWAVDALRSVGVDLLESDPDATVVDGNGAKWEYADK